MKNVSCIPYFHKIIHLSSCINRMNIGILKSFVKTWEERAQRNIRNHTICMVFNKVLHKMLMHVYSGWVNILAWIRIWLLKKSWIRLAISNKWDRFPINDRILCYGKWQENGLKEWWMSRRCLRVCLANISSYS